MEHKGMKEDAAEAMKHVFAVVQEKVSAALSYLMFKVGGDLLDVLQKTTQDAEADR